MLTSSLTSGLTSGHESYWNLPCSCATWDAKLDMHNGMLSQMLSLGKCIGRQKIEVRVVSLLCDLFLEICILPIYGFTWHFVAMPYPSVVTTIKYCHGMWIHVPDGSWTRKRITMMHILLLSMHNKQSELHQSSRRSFFFFSSLHSNKILI